MAVLGWLRTQGMFLLDASLPCWTAGVRDEQAVDGLGQSFPGPSFQGFPRSTAPIVNGHPVGVLCPSATVCLLERRPVCLPLGFSLTASLLFVCVCARGPLP